jgi:competence protein ComEC
MRYSLFYPSCAGFIIGVFLASLFSSYMNAVVLVVLTLIVSLVIFYFYQTNLSYSYTNSEKEIILKKYSLTFLALVSILGAAVGALRFDFFFNKTGDAIFENFIGQKITVEGVIVSDADEREKGIKFVLNVNVIKDDAGEYVLEKETKVVFTADLYSKLKYGDQVEVTGTLAVPENFESDNGRIFDYNAYLKKDSIFYLIQNPNMRIIDEHKGNKITELLFSIKHAFIRSMDKTIPFPESGLAAGLTVAGKRALPESVQEDFRKSGTTQVVVLSGYNVTIIAETFENILSFLPKSYAAIAGILGIILFTIMAGGSATIVRGSVMAVLVVAAGIFRRRYSVHRSFMTAAVVLLMLNPMLLVFDPSFQFSFLSTFGLMYFSPVIKKYFYWVPERWKLRETIVATSATQIFVLPFILFQTGDVSLMALPANLLLFLVLPITMLLCFMAGMIGFIATVLAVPFAWTGFLFLRYELSVVHYFAAFPSGFFTISHFPWWAMAVLFCCYDVTTICFYIHETAEPAQAPTINQIK